MLARSESCRTCVSLCARIAAATAPCCSIRRPLPSVERVRTKQTSNERTSKRASKPAATSNKHRATIDDHRSPVAYRQPRLLSGKVTNQIRGFTLSTTIHSPNSPCNDFGSVHLRRKGVLHYNLHIRLHLRLHFHCVKM